MYLDKAKDLADRMMPAFKTPSGLPLSYINLATGQGSVTKDNKGLVSTAEVSTLQLEFRYLSYLTGNDTYWDVVEKVHHSSVLSHSVHHTDVFGGNGGYQGFQPKHWFSVDLHEVSALKTFKITRTDMELNPARRTDIS